MLLKIKERSPRVFWSGVAASGLILLWGIYGPALAAIRKAGLERDRLHRELIQYRGIIDPLRRGELPTLPEAGDVSTVLEELNRLARQQQIRFLEVSPGVLRPGDPKEMMILPVDLQLQGEYRTLAEFLGRLSQTPALGAVTVRRLSIDREERFLPRLKARLSLEIFLSGVGRES